MNLARITFYLFTLLRNLLSVQGFTALLSSLGVLYTVLKCLDYFHLAVQADVQRFSWLFFGGGAVGAVWICRPKLRMACNLKNRDVVVEVAIGNLFSFDGAIVVGTNSTFDTEISARMISDKSVQGQFTKKYYGDHTLLEKEVDRELEASALACEKLDDGRQGNTKRYPIGTVIRVNPKGRIGYLLAITHVNQHGVSGDSSFEDLKQALGRLWVYIGDKGLKGPVVTPVIGSGFARLPQPRQVIAQEIIKSFIAACAEKVFCDKLTIVLAARDVRDHQVDFDALGDYLRHVCTYTEFAADTGERTGTPIK